MLIDGWMNKKMFTGRERERLPQCPSGKESACNAGATGDMGLIRVGKIPQRRAWKHTPVFLPRESPWTKEPSKLQSIVSEGVKHG